MMKEDVLNVVKRDTLLINVQEQETKEEDHDLILNLPHQKEVEAWVLDQTQDEMNRMNCYNMNNKYLKYTNESL